MNERLEKIRLLLLDVDGVMTDGRIIFDSNGVESKFFNVKDGHGIKMLQRVDIEVGIVSGRSSQVVTNRSVELGITRVHQGALDKLAVYNEVLAETGLTDAQIAFMGDDIIDLPILRRVGFGAVPVDAIAEVIPHAHYVARSRGGWGAVREVCDLILKAQGRWEESTSRYYR